MIYFVLLAMVFLHIVDDYYLQGWLASGKQKSWWEKQVPNLKDTKYSKDYIVALLMHGFSWSFMIHIPIFLFMGPSLLLFIFVIFQGLFHSLVDDQKANRGTINLIQDQGFHMIQIGLSFLLLVVL